MKQYQQKLNQNNMFSTNIAMEILVGLPKGLELIYLN